MWKACHRRRVPGNPGTRRLPDLGPTAVSGRGRIGFMLPRRRQGHSYQGAMIKTHRDGFPRLSARSVRRGDAGHRKACATTSESLGKPPFRSSMRPVGGRRKALTMQTHRQRLPSYPTDRMDDPYGSLSSLLGISGRAAIRRDNGWTPLQRSSERAWPGRQNGACGIGGPSADSGGSPVDPGLLSSDER